MQGDGLEDRPQFVIAIRATPEDIKAQVDLRIRGNANRFHRGDMLLRLWVAGCFLLCETALRRGCLFPSWRTRRPNGSRSWDHGPLVWPPYAIVLAHHRVCSV